MDREKQIEEMAYEIETRLGYLKSTCYNAANVLYHAGYRKQNNFAKKIFEDIEQLFIDVCETYHTMEPEDSYKLKKKYTGAQYGI